MIGALKHRYIKSKGPGGATPKDELLKFLRNVTDEDIEETANLIAIIAKSNPAWILSDEDKSILNSVDDCAKLIFNLIDIEAEIDQQLRTVIPEVACQLLSNPALPLDLPDYSVLEIIDLLVSACVGWVPELGRSGEQFYKKVGEVIAEIKSSKEDYKVIEADLRAFLGKEQKRTNKVEERLVASETGLLLSKKCRIKTAEMINMEMVGKRLTSPIVKFLQGPWYDSLQLLALTKGLDSPQWARAVKMTATIIWTFQPTELDDVVAIENEKQHLYRTIEQIPEKIRKLLVALEHKAEIAEEALQIIEREHIRVMSGLVLVPSKFIPIDTGEALSSQKTSVSRVLLRKVNNLQPGQWFTFEEEGKAVRIKLVLKLEDTKHVVFTNRNGMKALEKSFDELAYYLSAGVITPLNQDDIFTSTFASYYHGLLASFKRQPARESDREDASKIAARDKEIAEHATRARKKEAALRAQQEKAKKARLAHARRETSKDEHRDKVKSLTETVQALNIGAWLKLPDEAGVIEECRLAVKVARLDKMIFVDRAGLIIGEYETEELVQLLVVGEGEIEDPEIEVKDTLAEVVKKLRQDRDKSYDELTGG